MRAAKLLGSRALALSWFAAVTVATAFGSGSSDGLRDRLPAPPSHSPPQGQGAMAQGARVTFQSLRDASVTHTQRARLLSLAVERGETPSPYLAPGAFRATYRAVVTLRARDRMRFRIEGKGKATLKIGDKVVLDGRMGRRGGLESEKAVRLRKGANELELTFQSSARGDGQMRLFWSGLDFGFEPILPEMLSFPADDPDVARSDELRTGQQLFVERRCARCHNYDELRVSESSNQELNRVGPDLRRVGARVHPSFLVDWLRNPHAIRPDASMPKFALRSGEAEDIAAYLAATGEPLPAKEFTAEQREAGGERFRELGCVACHLHAEEPSNTAELGGRIDLGYVRAKYQSTSLSLYLQDPTRHHPDIRMPSLKLSVDDADSLAAYLLDGAEVATAKAGDAKNGRRLVQANGCVLCHALPDDVPPADRIFPLLATLKLDRGCLADDPAAAGKAPDHKLEPAQRQALRAFLPFANEIPFRRSPLDFVARHIDSERCQACHAMDGMPSTWARLAERWSEEEPLPPEQDPIAQGVPSLTWVGAKLQPSWLRGFLRGEEASPRPWLTARMPKFARHGEAIARGLSREHGYDDRDEPVRDGDAELAVHGQRLLKMGTGFGCVQCHAVGDKKATQVFEREGINLVTARRRLRHEYYTRWLRDPPRLDPEARMPKYADDRGRTAFTDVLGGDADKQFESIWQYLGGLAK
ncbi:MAG: cytochrome c family protein [Planctomycetota bacterium]